MISTYIDNENVPPQSGEDCDRQNDHRLNAINKYMHLSTKLTGVHACRRCEQENTIQSTTTYEGHAALVRHLVLSLVSSDWVVDGRNPTRSGIHTETAKQWRMCNDQVSLLLICPIHNAFILIVRSRGRKLVEEAITTMLLWSTYNLTLYKTWTSKRPWKTSSNI